ncbi:MAG: cysteine desulfurase NifS [Bdellovibrionales bacterium RIFOXYD12_FULL_39_22]|nr:MAG: cysteine desulfurase NifS [Bdellovibrionales bacterium RIFOXYB1_FULL_39_21]OFZ43247.1 MAG: cysteine desulfurase NifS [Bdellovibrionales bacterium RIFOXYC12_FULL_39_17]OFZ47985.1 MAG: cysteine desulfurase NifS [Bdellovibrionales bacterium RIFOXYC1_FULL_39_130]OFZ75765.1 MAG: cysteine desulfurase NifS [Bdellovibrionales bacterium RIFOXYD1_FULL_39_84]OFZ94255.1 MAG: cysteine desulfurase NifS [Bdellovibrionales bacterium RIFOXYD12_FULL_39_22]HLE11674.1 cysteine desulfurase NifS [Bacteriovo
MNLNETIYLDNNATTKIDPTVVTAMQPFFTDYFFNPSSLYPQAQTSRYAIETARAQIASFLGANKDNEIIFTGSATESNNSAIRGVLQANPSRKHIITTSVEHPAIFELCKDLERFGYSVTYLAVNENGELDIKELINAIRPDTAIVSIMHANNETGVIFPIEQISRIVKLTDNQIIFHTDATQTAGKLTINLKANFPYIDLLSFSGHKLHAPKGIGVLYCKAGTRWRPSMIGGHQEHGKRAGTENVPYIIGLAQACKLAQEHLQTENQIQDMRDRLEIFLKEQIKAIKINGSGNKRLSSTTNVSFQGIEGESIIYALNEHNICASTGSACSSGSLAPSHVLQAMKVPFSFAHGSIRFSFGRYNSENDLQKVMQVLPNIVKSLRKISPFWDSNNETPTGF